MIKKTLYERMARTMLVVALTDLIFWVIYRKFTGSVPQISRFNIDSSLVITLPFAITRGWDVLFAVILTPIVAFMLSRNGMKDDAPIPTLCIGLLVGAVFGLPVPFLSTSTAHGLSCIAFIGFLIGLSSNKLMVYLIVSCFLGLIIGLFAGSIYGLASIIVLTLFAILAGTLNFLFKNYKPIVKRIFYWVWPSEK